VLVALGKLAYRRNSDLSTFLHIIFNVTTFSTSCVFTYKGFTCDTAALGEIKDFRVMIIAGGLAAAWVTAQSLVNNASRVLGKGQYAQPTPQLAAGEAPAANPRAAETIPH
jgi:hypothetical protein